VSKDRYNEVSDKFYTKLNGWRPSFNNIKTLYLKNGSDWKKTPIKDAKGISKKEAWKTMPQEAIDYISSIVEFDYEMFKLITDIDVKNSKVKVVCEGKEVEISRESAKALGFLD